MARTKNIRENLLRLSTYSLGFVWDTVENTG